MPEKKIKVIHILQRINAGGKENGIINLSNYLDRRKFKPMICCLKGLGVMAERLKEDVEVFNMRFPEGRSLMRPFILANFFRKIKPDIIHTHSWNGGLLDGVIGSRLSNTPVIINGEHGYFGRKHYQIMLQRILFFFCDSYLSVSDELKQEFSSTVKVPQSRIKVIHNGVDTDRFSGKYDTERMRSCIYERFGFKINANDFVLGSIGNLKPSKNHKMLLAVVKQMVTDDRSNNIKAIIAGEGPDRAMLEGLISDYSLQDKILLLGHRDDIPQLLSLFNTLVVCSEKNSEGLPNVILEAMSSGITVISTKTTGATEIIKDSTNGFLVESVNELIAKIKVLSFNRELCLAMGRKARDLVIEKYSLAKMINAYERLYLELLERKKFSHDTV